MTSYDIMSSVLNVTGAGITRGNYITLACLVTAV